MSADKRRSVLMVAFHYPPCATSSGLQRTLSFSKHLLKHGWDPIVLTVHPSAHERTSPEQLTDIPADVEVVRTLAPDTARHLSIRGRYWSRLAVPDRWHTWAWSAMPIGIALAQRRGIDVIWSTYPITTAHAIAARIARWTGRPWVADFRDPMVEYLPESREWFPKDERVRTARLRIESEAARRADQLVFCTAGALHIVKERYPAIEAASLHVIPNGYEETAFRDAESRVKPRTSSRRVLLHSGTVYPGPDRDPTSLFVALSRLAARGIATAENFELRLRDPTHEQYFRDLAAKHGIAALVSVAPSVPYREALGEMMSADGLLILQGYPSNPAVPAKLYEYLRAGRPIIGLAHPDGETAAAMRQLGITSTAPLTDDVAIESLLARWLAAPGVMEGSTALRSSAEAYSRERLTASLASVLEAAATAGRR